jgi:ribosomal protein S18 acetylase RimI-like enzyme
VTLRDGRSVWIRTPRPEAGLATIDHHWCREVVDATGRVVGSASYEAGSSRAGVATCWVADDWRSVGLGTRLWAMATAAAVRHGLRWLTVDIASGDAAAQNLLDTSGWIVARRVRGGDTRVAVLLAPDPLERSRPGAARAA